MQSKLYFKFYIIINFRTALACLHWNHNANRAIAKNPDGTTKYKVGYPKAKAGDPSVSVVKAATSYGKQRVFLMNKKVSFHVLQV